MSIPALLSTLLFLSLIYAENIIHFTPSDCNPTAIQITKLDANISIVVLCTCTNYPVLQITSLVEFNEDIPLLIPLRSEQSFETLSNMHILRYVAAPLPFGNCQFQVIHLYIPYLILPKSK